MKAYFVPIYILMGSTELESAVSEIKKDAIWKSDKLLPLIRGQELPHQTKSRYLHGVKKKTNLVSQQGWGGDWGRGEYCLP